MSFFTSYLLANLYIASPEGGGAGANPISQLNFGLDPSFQPNVGSNPIYQIWIPIFIARLRTDARYEVNALIDAFCIPYLPVNTLFLPNLVGITLLKPLLSSATPASEYQLRCCCNRHVDQCGQEPSRAVHQNHVSSGTELCSNGNTNCKSSGLSDV